MRDENKARKQLINKLEEMPERIAELETLEIQPKQIEKKLHESDDKEFKILAERLDEVVYRANPKTFAATYVNRAIEKIYGYTAEEWINDPKLWVNTIHPEDKERVIAEITELMSKFENKAMEYRIIRKDKTTRWVRDHVSLEKDQQGPVISISGFLCDITDQKRVEERMLIRDRAFTSVTNGILITDARQPDNPIIHCNPAFEKITGYSRDEIIGRSCRFLQNDDNDQEGIKELRKAIEVGREHKVLLRNYKKDGTFFWNELTISPVEDESGKLTHFVHVINDVTESKASEELLKISHAELEQRVGIRTKEITEVNESLRVENEKRKRAEEELNKRNRDLELLNAITQAVHESLDLEEVYKIALDMTTALENVDMAMIYLVDDDNKEAVLQVSRNVPEDYIHRAGRIPYPKGVTWKVINTGVIINIEDIQKDSNVGPAGKDIGHHSALGIPISLEEQVIGVIWFLSYKERWFDREERNLLSTIGDQISLAISKAKLYGELSKKNRYEKIIRTVTQSVHQSIDLQEVLENAVDEIIKNLDSVDKVSIHQVEGKEVVIKAYRGTPAWYIDRAGRIPYPNGYTWRVIMDGKPRYCPDADQDSYIVPAGRELGIKSYLSMPIHFGGDTIGAINVNSFHKNAFDDDELKLLEIVANQIEVAINIARQTEALRNSEDALQKTNEELELRVKERTQKLSEINKELKKENAKRRSAEEHTKKSLQEKEILLREIQHRVRNNLQIVTGLLYLQSGQFKDKEINNAFNETQNRVRSMALIHEHIYQSKDLRSINFGDYVRNIGTYLLNSYGIKPKDIRLKIKIRNASMNADKAILCGLIVNELISNALKHAFPNGKEGEICIELDSLNSNCVLTVSDNGIGFPKDLKYRKAKSLGLQLLTALTDQLDGSIKINRRSGTSFKITFPEK
ncbi:GAF domain-containing protein [Desulfobacterota bacterium AH_259_B03_O07]|nr:GAF domain-containing protein [Desulfobacterota bacterium AH_259_B03_O07]